MKTTPYKQPILDYLKGKDWIGPTEIGINVGHKTYNSAAAWASPKLQILLREHLIMRNEKGLVRLLGDEDMELL